MKHRTYLVALLLTAAAVGGGCRSAHVTRNTADPIEVFVRTSEIAGVDRREIDPVWKHDGKVFLYLYVESEEAQRRLRLGEVPLPYGSAVYITDGSELIARGQIETECLYVTSSGSWSALPIEVRQMGVRCAFGGRIHGMP